MTEMRAEALPAGGLTAGSVRHPLCGGRRTWRRSLAERPAAEFLAPVRFEPAGLLGSGRDDLGRVQAGVHAVVVLLGLGEVDRVAEARRLEQVPRARPAHR